MLRKGIAFLLGHCCIHCLSELPDASALGTGALFTCGVLLLAAPLLFKSCRGIFILAAAFLFGAGWALGHAVARLSDDLPAALEGVDLLVVGHIASLPDTVDADPQFELEVATPAAGVPRHIRLAWYDSVAQPRAGELWQFVVRLKRRNGFANPGGFDYEGYLFRQGIGATGYIRTDDRNLRLAPASPRYAVLRARAWIGQRVHAAVGDHPMLGVLQGLAVGDTHAMSAQQWRVFAATGTTHLMAISGLHISMIATLGAWLGSALVRWPRAQRLRLDAVHGQVIGGVFGAVSYALLAGLSVPTQRTLIMLCIYFGARWCRRELGAGRVIGMALIGVLLVDPFAPLAIGAWLSFGAVAIILLAVSGRLVEEGTIRSFARVQFAVTVGLVPILIATFGSLSLVSPLANAAAVPFFTCLLVPLVLVGSVAAAVWLPAGSIVLGFAAWMLDACWPVLQWSAQLPLATWYFPQLPVLATIALTLGALLFVLPGIWPLRVVAASLCIPAWLFQPAAPAAGSFKLTLLDVGQGLSVTIRTHAHTLVYDAGPAFRTGRDTGELVVLPYLRSQGIRRVDLLMISHGDLDHRGGMRSIVGGLPVTTLRIGPSVKAAGLRTQQCRRGQRWRWDEVEFEVLHPVSGAYVRDNDSSCVLRVSGVGGSVLLTGDIQRDAEAALIDAGLMHVDAVVVPHHGSRTSSTQVFVDATRPRLALFGTGYRNRWAFPKPDVVARWKKAGALPLASADTGAVEVSFDAAGMQAPRLHRSATRRYWRTR